MSAKYLKLALAVPITPSIEPEVCMRSILSVLVLVSVTAVAACGGGDQAASESSASSGAASASNDASKVSWDPSTITPAMIALGDSIFHGLKGAASCQACHGPGGDQGAAAPILTDTVWLHGDGSWEGIYKTVKEGVMSPKQYSSVMPPYGGAPLDLEQARAVTAYVYKLSHK